MYRACFVVIYVDIIMWLYHKNICIHIRNIRVNLIDELYLISAGADMEILIWDMTAGDVIRRLQGHSDIISSIAISSDCSLMVSSSMDMLLKTWFLTPRAPDAPQPPIFLSKTDTTVMIKWSSPPSFNLEISAYQLQYRVGLRGRWLPNPRTHPPITISPWSRSMIVPNLEPSTPYQFRLQAENEMGSSDWGGPSKLITTDLGIPICLERPTSCEASMTSVTFFWFTPNPAIFTGASKLFHINHSGDTKSYEEHPTLTASLDACLAQGSILVEKFRAVLLEYNISLLERKRRKADVMTAASEQEEGVHLGRGRMNQEQNVHARNVDDSGSESDDDFFSRHGSLNPATLSPTLKPPLTSTEYPTLSPTLSPTLQITDTAKVEPDGEVKGKELILVKNEECVDGSRQGQSECRLHPLAIERVISWNTDICLVAILCMNKCLCVSIHVSLPEFDT